MLKKSTEYSQNNYFDKSDNNKIILLSNTSRYLFHYRYLLINKLKRFYRDVYIFAPFDQSSENLKKVSEYREWKLSYKNHYDLKNLFNSFLKLLIEIKNINPYILHSHTLKPNLLISITSFFFGNNIIISFAGMGRLSKSKGVKSILLKFILKIIYYSSTHEFINLIFIKKNLSKVRFIFQNPNDIIFFKKLIKNPQNRALFFLIPGSGVPEKYFQSTKKYFYESNKNFDFLFCARLEKSKGIKLFIDLSNYYPESKFFIYGNLNGNSKDYLNEKEINHYKNKNKNLLFMDYVDDPLLNHHNDKTIFFIPSNYGEGLPRGILEALSLGIPTVASKNSCVGLFDKKHLFKVNDNKINSYLKAIETIKIKKESGYLDEFLKNGIDLVSEKYKESIIVEKTINLYKSF